MAPGSLQIKHRHILEFDLRSLQYESLKGSTIIQPEIFQKVAAREVSVPRSDFVKTGISIV